MPVRGDVAMTGEVTLRGRVLAIGGLKEKSVAAHREGIHHVIIPAANARELDELPAEVRASVAFHPVKTMDEVLELGLRRPIQSAVPRNTPARGRNARAPAPTHPSPPRHPGRTRLGGAAAR